MEGKPRGRATVCISEAFGFLNDPMYDEKHDSENDQSPFTLKKSLSVDSGTSMLQNKNSQNNRLNEIIKSKEIEEEREDDSYRIVAYLDPGEKENSTNGEVMTRVGDFSGEITVGNNDEEDIPVIETYVDNAEDVFTIVTCVDDNDIVSPVSTHRNDLDIVSPVSKQCNDLDIVSPVSTQHNDLDIENVPVIRDNSCAAASKTQNNECVKKLNNCDISPNQSNQNGPSISDSCNDDDVVVLRPKSSVLSEDGDSISVTSSVGRSRRTQQIVSDAFHFLKDLDDEEEENNSPRNVLSLETIQENEAGSSQRRAGLKRSDAIESSDGDAVHPSEVKLHPSEVKLHQEMLNGDSSRNDLDAVSTTSSSGESQGSGATLRRKKSRARQETGEEGTEGSEISSDEEDTGVYNESFRRSCWVRVGDNSQLLSNNYQQDSIDQSIDKQDDVFSEDTSAPGIKKNFHKRSDSNATTTSESEFKKAYQFKKKCIVQRSESQQEYQRLSEKFYDEEKVVILERLDPSTDLGLHILDSHPAVITSVDKDSPAEKAGVKEGQILISVNRVNVLQSSHDEIISLVQQNPAKVTLEVGSSDLHLIRDLQSTVLEGYMHQKSSSILRQWKKRYFVLRQDNCLYSYKTQQELQEPLGAIPLLNYTVSKNNDNSRQNCFKAEKYGAKTYYFSVESREQMAKWVCVMNEAAVMSKKRKDSWMDVTSHNVGLPALDIRKAECSGYISKSNRAMRNWNKRYCVLKDACIYYYKHMNSQSAQGMAHLHGYTVDQSGINGKRNSFVLHPPEPQMRKFFFCAENETDKLRWVNAITKSVQRWIKVD